MNWLHRAGYRVRQFGSAVATRGRPLAEVERTEVRAWLPTAAWPLFEGMPRNDQRHSLNVLRTLAAAGHDDPALMQAALLHDAAKSTGGVMLWHRVAVVLLKVVRSGWPAHMAGRPAPRRSDLRYPFWASVNHPRLGGEMAAEAGCDPLAVTLIRRHQETSGGAEERGSGHLNSAGSSHLDLQVSNFAPDDPLADKLLAALQAADDDN